MPVHTVVQGDSIISLSKQYGVPVQKIWNHPDNRQLRERNRGVSILLPGDQVTIPEKGVRTESAATDMRHRYLCRTRTAWLKVRFAREGRARAGEAFQVMAGGFEAEGNLDDDGMLAVRIPADAQEAVVLIGEGESRERYNLRVGHLDPITEARGVQQRLNNLGFFCGREDDEIGPKTTAALSLFQQQQGLEVTGELDDATRDRLRQAHGS